MASLTYIFPFLQKEEIQLTVVGGKIRLDVD